MTPDIEKLIGKLRAHEGIGAALAPTAATAKHVNALMDQAADALASVVRDLAQRDDLLIKAEKLRFGPDLTVESRGRSLWAVCQPGNVLNSDGEWEWEPQPSSRSDEFIARTRFTFADAVTKARSLSSERREGP